MSTVPLSPPVPPIGSRLRATVAALWANRRVRTLVEAVLWSGLWTLVPVLPFWPERMLNVTQLIWLPGLWLAGLFYPEGIHTGLGSSAYLLVAGALNWLEYTIAIYFLLIGLQVAFTKIFDRPKERGRVPFRG